jgi:hypothetical protein
MADLPDGVDRYTMQAAVAWDFVVRTYGNRNV